jgi:hypothetical protein
MKRSHLRRKTRKSRTVPDLRVLFTILFYFDRPAKFVFDYAALDAGDGIIYFLRQRAYLTVIDGDDMTIIVNSPMGEITAAVPVPKASSNCPLA